LAVPLSTLAGWKLSGLLLQLLNIDLPKLEIIPMAWIVQIVVGLCVPVIAALFPVFEGARITIRQAIQSYGVSAPFGHHWLEKMLLNLQGLSLALALSGRNALRSKQRSLLTLAMMTISGLLFISVMSLKGSFQSTLMEMASTFHYDVEIDFAEPQRSGEIRQLAARIPEVTYTEMHWTGEQAIKFENTNERSVSLRALPPDSQIYTPKVVAGRWLSPGDGQTIVLNAKIAEEEGVNVGDYVSMTSDGKSTKWQVVGLVFDTSNRQRTAFVSLRTFARIKQQEGLATDLMIQTREKSDATQETVERSLVDLYEKHNLLLLYTTAFNTMMAQQLAPFDILLYLFLSMSILAALVGGLGLMGAMLLSVKERTREIGVMRAVGGDSLEISKIFVSEGLMLGFLSWLIAALLSTPVSRVFAQAIGVAMFGLPLNENISFYGIVLWLIIVLLISALASAWPALQAARVSVRESLAYE
jgi:putative ABC transport system permease protein